MTAEQHTVTVGSSDVPSILGLSPWTTPAETWARLVGIVPRYSVSDTPATRRGRIIESALIDEWARLNSPTTVERGPSITETPVIVDGWRAARPDAVAVLGQSRVVVEAKTTRGWDSWGMDGTDQVPVYYAAQVAWQLSVVGVERADVIAYCPMDDGIRVYTITRNEALERVIVDRVRAWMEAYVWPEEPVQPAPLPMRVVASRYGDGGEEATWVDPTDDDRAAALELREVRAAKSSLEEREEALKARLCERIGDSYGLKNLCTWGRVKGRETVNPSDLKAGWPEVYAQVAKRSASSRVFRLTLKESK